MNRNEHLAPERIDDLRAGRLASDEVIEMLTHIGECVHCAEALGERYKENELLRLPPEFSRKVMETLGIERVSHSIGKKNGICELYAYSFRVGIAACIALMLLFSGTLNYGVSLGQSIHGDFKAVERITENLRGFSDRLIDFKGMTDLKEVL
ncbi:hypothetical protein FRZ06_09480 [Anoxybacterium hadale]|uniref:Uncharacterized protein n=1 Tax=Anoxybacterium hadale TaxID=3408580 RepID=A0ACD1AAS7_9FIRM|nr:hypothetical protein FRZ06_09480 [Clostridiales bacterium]